MLSTLRIVFSIWYHSIECRIDVQLGLDSNLTTRFVRAPYALYSLFFHPVHIVEAQIECLRNNVYQRE